MLWKQYEMCHGYYSRVILEKYQKKNIKRHFRSRLPSFLNPPVTWRHDPWSVNLTGAKSPRDQTKCTEHTHCVARWAGSWPSISNTVENKTLSYFKGSSFLLCLDSWLRLPYPNGKNPQRWSELLDKQPIRSTDWLHMQYCQTADERSHIYT